ncbi:CsbD family protein [Roseomonas nepalensis]|uniref:CsbD family protein n=1 Tax=Muricoccus nepalensis TaxID=1854500 RepID=A0A502FIL7_9PROT|nr:CsbD family protein [Roseomonas nepalensis]TPG49320.1 CsbD family protein [Roseomonas nepalensis]
MDKDPVPGTAERMKASIKDAIGTLTGDPRAKPEGCTEKPQTEVRSTAADTEGEPESATRE